MTIMLWWLIVSISIACTPNCWLGGPCRWSRVCGTYKMPGRYSTDKFRVVFFILYRLRPNNFTLVLSFSLSSFLDFFSSSSCPVYLKLWSHRCIGRIQSVCLNVRPQTFLNWAFSNETLSTDSHKLLSRDLWLSLQRPLSDLLASDSLLWLCCHIFVYCV